MTITSIGYEGTVDYADWAVLITSQGAPYSVFAADGFAVAAGAGTREVTVQPGRASGHGILDDSDAVETLTGASVSSGSRWDLVALRRDWAAGTTTPVLIQGTSSKAIPTRETDPGVEDDQPIALVRFAAGLTAVQEVVDLRVWKGAVARDLLARDYHTDIGSRLRILGVTWVLGFDGTTPTWVPDSNFVGTTSPPYADNLVWVKVP